MPDENNTGPESELERLECQEEMTNNNDTNPNERETIPDLQSDTNTTLSKEFPTQTIQRAEGLSIMLTLNDQQTLIFDKIRTCCLDKVNGKNPDPFRIISLTLRRQKNQEFAKTLNRLRKHEKGDELYERSLTKTTPDRQWRT